jgi:hypothetical protein
VTSAAPSTTVDSVLWLTLRGAAGVLPVVWLAWLVVAVLAAPPLVAALGPAGGVLVILAGGWLAACRLQSPLEWLRRYHLDDAEVTVMGPGQRVRRLPWCRVQGFTQERQALRLEGGGLALRLPLLPLVRAGAWERVLARVVPELASEMWALLDEGEALRLAPPHDPPLRGLAPWAYLPALAACVAAAGPIGLAVGTAVALAERTVGWLRVRAGAVMLHRTGVALRKRMRGLFVAWPRAEVTSLPRGLVVGVADGAVGVVSSALPNFWAAAAVIEMKARLGARADAAVHFRARLGSGGFSVVGEVEPTA